ncbi:hypothetical protein BH10CYA1_BH10CYA1_32310 [soil metagenome]
MTTDLIFQMLLFAVLGLGLEVVFTGILDSRRSNSRHFIGYSSLWYLPLYSISPIFLHLAGASLFALPVVIRGLIYMTAIFAVEYAGMLCLRKLLSSSPSEVAYYQSRWNIHGLIRLDFAPAMFLMGLFFEFIYRRIN